MNDEMTIIYKISDQSPEDAISRRLDLHHQLTHVWKNEFAQELDNFIDFIGTRFAISFDSTE